MTPQIDKALRHVREHYPNVTMVVFNRSGIWQYFTEEFEAPVFGKEIDATILEEALDSIETLPAVFEI